MNGILLIDKPAGYTSFDVVAVVRRLANQRKVGHTGTLDPNATGVLPILLGTATKAQTLILNHDKEYVSSFLLGKTTDTLDIWGEVKTETKSNVSKERLLAVLPEFEGEIEQIPPMFSAVKKNGQRLYKLAREGIEIEREKRRAVVYSLKLTSFDESSQGGTLEIACSKGTYIRTIIDDIGKRLGCGAVMTALRRTKACGFPLDECINLKEAENKLDKTEIEKYLRPTESLFTEYSEVIVSDSQAKRFSNGGALDINRTSLAKSNAANGSVYRIKSRSGEFLGLGRTDIKSGMLKIHFQNRRG